MPQYSIITIDAQITKAFKKLKMKKLGEKYEIILFKFTDSFF